MEKVNFLKEIKIAGVLVVSVSLICSIIFFFMNYISLQTSTAVVSDRIKQAFTERELIRTDYSAYDTEIGAHQLNECLILTMTLLRSKSIIHDVISPSYTVRRRNVEGSIPRCESLYQEVFSIVDDNNRTIFYHRYLHGHRMLAGILLSSMDISTIHRILSATSYGLLWTIIILAVLKSIFTNRKFNKKPKSIYFSPELFLAIIAVIFLNFYGLQYFGMSLSYAPSAIVLFIFLLYWIWFDPINVTKRHFYAVVAIFAALTAYFEFFNGSAPIGLAMLIGVLSIFGLYNENRASFYKRIIIAPMVYTGTMVMCFLIKLASASIVFGLSIWNDFFGSLLNRMHGDIERDSQIVEYSLFTMARSLTWYLEYIGIGHSIYERMVLVIFIIAVFLGYCILIRKAEDQRQRIAFTAMIASMAVIFGWYILFQQHTVIHVFYMVRMLVWPLAMGMVLIMLAVGKILADTKYYAQ